MESKGVEETEAQEYQQGPIFQTTKDEAKFIGKRLPPGFSLERMIRPQPNRGLLPKGLAAESLNLAGKKREHKSSVIDTESWTTRCYSLLARLESTGMGTRFTKMLEGSVFIDKRIPKTQQQSFDLGYIRKKLQKHDYIGPQYFLKEVENVWNLARQHANGNEELINLVNTMESKFNQMYEGKDETDLTELVPLSKRETHRILGVPKKRIFAKKISKVKVEAEEGRDQDKEPKEGNQTEGGSTSKPPASSEVAKKGKRRPKPTRGPGRPRNEYKHYMAAVARGELKPPLPLYPKKVLTKRGPVKPTGSKSKEESTNKVDDIDLEKFKEELQEYIKDATTEDKVGIWSILTNHNKNLQHSTEIEIVVENLSKEALTELVTFIRKTKIRENIFMSNPDRQVIDRSQDNIARQSREGDSSRTSFETNSST